MSSIRIVYFSFTDEYDQFRCFKVEDFTNSYDQSIIHMCNKVLQDASTEFNLNNYKMSENCPFDSKYHIESYSDLKSFLTRFMWGLD
jgi:hypothetical protein